MPVTAVHWIHHDSRDWPGLRLADQGARGEHALRAKRLRTPAALAGRIDLRYTNDELEAMEEELKRAIE